MAPYLRLGKMFAKARKANDITQAQVAERYGYQTAQFISNWERGQSFPPIKIFKDLCKYYGIDLELAKKKLRLLRIAQIEKELNQIDQGKLF